MNSHQGVTVMHLDVLRTAAGHLVLGIHLLAGGIGKAYADQPTGWGGGGEGYELSRDDTEKHGGKASGCVRSTGNGTDGFGTLTQWFRADGYRGKRVRMSAYVKTDGVEGKAGLWMRIDGKEKTGLAFDNMMGRPVQGTTDWKKYEVVLDVPEEAEEIFFGFLVAGKGRGWVDDIAFQVVDKDVPTTGLEIQPSDRQGELTKDVPKEPKNLDFEQ
jgi:hypothetical protein